MTRLVEAEAAAAAARLEPNFGPTRVEHNLAAVRARALQASRRRKLVGMSAGLLLAAATCFVLVTRFWRTPGGEAYVAAQSALNRTQFADGSVAHNYKTLTFKQGLKSEVVLKSNGKIDGWKLTGIGGLTFVKQEITGAPLYDGFAGGLHVEQSHAFGSDLFVNNVLLPETPVEVPVA